MDEDNKKLLESFEVNEQEIKDSIVEFLRLIASSDSERISLNDFVRKKSPTVKDALIGMLYAINIFDCLLIDKNSDDILISPVNNIAANFLISYAQYIDNGDKAIPTWEPLSINNHKTDLLIESGIELLYFMEKKRSLVPENKTKYLREINVLLLLMKAKFYNKAGERYLFQYTNETLRFQLVGGKIREEYKNIEEAIEWQLQKELSFNKLSVGKNVKASKIIEDLVAYDVSFRKSGLYTKYSISIYYLEIDQDELKLTSKDRWLSLKELAGLHIHTAL